MKRESSAIRVSAWATAFFGVLGTSFGIWLDSEAILLDGVFNWISFAMALVSLRVARLIEGPSDEEFPFGYAAFEPALNTVKSVLVLGVSVFALIGAINTILDGGRQLSAGWAIVYALVAVVGCFSVSFYQDRVAKALGSPLLAVDAKNWLVNGAVSSAVGVAFGLAMLMEGTALDEFVPYVDSSLVVLLVLLTFPIPARMAINGLGELLAFRPPAADMELLERAVSESSQPEVRRVRIRANRLGRTLLAVVDAEVDPARTLDELEQVRQRITDRAGVDFPSLQLALMFHPLLPDD
jgi:cation diffusion facilitator family transporter